LQPIQLAQHALDQRNAAHFYHALGVVGGQLAQSGAHASRQDDCLHDRLLLP